MTESRAAISTETSQRTVAVEGRLIALPRQADTLQHLSHVFQSCLGEGVYFYKDALSIPPRFKERCKSKKPVCTWKNSDLKV